MKRKWILALCLLLGFILVGRMISSQNSPKHSWDISDLEIEMTSESLKDISFENAVYLEEKLSSSENTAGAEETLKSLEKEVMDLTGKSVRYYEYTGAFTIKGSNDVQGALTTLVIAVDDMAAYIYAVRDPFADVWCEHGDVEWVHMSSSSNISADKRSARLAAAGYITVLTSDAKHSVQLSNTLYPACTVSLR